MDILVLRLLNLGIVRGIFWKSRTAERLRIIFLSGSIDSDADAMLRDSRDMIRRLEREGYVLRAVKGSHHKFFHDGLRRMVTVPHSKRDLPLGTVYSIYRQAGWPRER